MGKADIQRICVGPTDSLRSILAVLQNSPYQICLVIDDEGHVLGTITDGDCRRAILGSGSLEIQASQVMNRQFVMVDTSFSLDHVRSLMLANRIAQVPVIDEHRKIVDLITTAHWEVKEPKRRENAALILAGGKGQRLRPLTRHFPKPMLPINGRPIIEHLVQGLVEANILRIYISINYLGNQIRNYFGTGERFGCSISYLEESSELGTAGPLRLLEGVTESPVVVINGDLVTSVAFGAFLDFHSSNRFDLTIGLSNHIVEVPFGVVSVNNAGRVERIHEKPVFTYQVSAGLYVVDPGAIALIPPNELYPMTDLIDSLLKSGRPIGGFPLHEPWFDIGVPEQYFRVQIEQSDELSTSQPGPDRPDNR